MPPARRHANAGNQQTGIAPAGCNLEVRDLDATRLVVGPFRAPRRHRPSLSGGPSLSGVAGCRGCWSLRAMVTESDKPLVDLSDYEPEVPDASV